MKFSFSSGTTSKAAAPMTSNFSKIKAFERISPFEVKPENLSENERDEFYKHISELKGTYANFKHYFLDQKLYKPTELIDTFWQITWFGYNLPLTQLAHFVEQKYSSHPSGLQQFMIQHRGTDNGKQITSLMLVFDRYFWLTSESQFSVSVSQRKVVGVVKPGWNLEKSREMFKQGDIQHKLVWHPRQKDEESSDQQESSERRPSEYQEMEMEASKKKHKVDQLSQILESKVPSKDWFTSVLLQCLKQSSNDIRKDLLAFQSKISEKLEDIKVLLSEEHHKKDKEAEMKEAKKRGGAKKQADMKSQPILDKGDQVKKENPKLAKVEDEVEQK